MKQSAVCGLIVGDRILILKRQYRVNKSNGWCLPGGKVEPGEAIVDGAIRETFEESGITIKDPIYVGQCASGSGEFMVNVYYTILNDIEKVTLSVREHSDYFWVAFDKLKNFDLAGNTQCFIDLILNDITSDNN